MSGHYEHFGKYILLEKLATGGMAEVFLARGNGAGGIGKFFAIKRILPQYADSPEFIEMFKDEAKIAINLNHSNIVSIHEFGVEKGQFFLVMDYVEGRNLRQILNKMKKSAVQFSIDQIVYVIKEVGAGLDHAHRCIDGSTGKPLNITHRDMSPQNVMVSFEGEVKIVDFGIAKAESQIESTRAGTLKGKFGYMSPEQAEGQPVDLRTDIFSLGIVLWELLANDRLFVANNEINTLRKIRDCQIPSLRKINPNIHTELERVVQKALARDRNLRYQTGAALQRDLNRFLNRQYPDFSAQDFSVFIKSVFADEILSLRKRLVEYTKVNLSISLDIRRPGKDRKDTEDSTQTSLVSKDTNSVVISTNSEGGADTASDSMPRNLGGTSTQTEAIPATTVRTNEDSLVTASETSEPLSIRTSDSNPHLQLSSPSLQLTNNTIVAGVTNYPNPDPNTQTETDGVPTGLHKITNQKSSAASLLDDNILQNAMNSGSPNTSANSRIQPIEIKAGDVLDAPDLPVPINQPGGDQPSQPRQLRTLNNSSASSAQPKRKAKSDGAGPMRLATFMVFALLCLSVYAYLAKYFTASMAPVIAMTDPILGDFHDLIGVSRPTGPIAGGEPCLNPPCGTNPRGPSCAEDPSQIKCQPDVLEPTSQGLVITSNPSGAEIWIDEQPTGQVTPSPIRVTNTFSVTIRKKGYAEFKVSNVTRETLGHRLDVTMQKLNIAYLDVEIFPPQPANLFVNGKQYPLRKGAIREIAVPGGTPIKVRAETLSGSLYEEMTLSIPTDKRKVVQLNPRKSRAPTSETRPNMNLKDPTGAQSK